MIGHDLIDLSLIQPTSSDRLRRLRSKVLGAQEAALLDKDFDPQLGYWLAWASKEAVYKLEYKTDPHRYFRPRAITCRELIMDSAFGTFQLRVQGQSGIFPVYIRKTVTCLEAFALERDTLLPFLRRYSGNMAGSGVWKKEDTRRGLFHLLSRDYPVEQLGFQREPFPRLFYRNKELPISISHDGDWLSLALLDIPRNFFLRCCLS